MRAAERPFRLRRARPALVVAALLTLLIRPAAAEPAAPAPDEPPAIEDASVPEISAAVMENVLNGDRATLPADKQRAYRSARDLFAELRQIAAQTETIRPEQSPEAARSALAQLAASGLSGDVLAMHDFEWSLAAFKTAGDDAKAAAGDAVDLDMIIRDVSDPRYRLAAFIDLGRAELGRNADARARRYAKLAIGELEGLRPPEDRIAGAQAVLRLAVDAGPLRLANAAAQAIELMPSASARAKASADLARATLAADEAALAPAALAAKTAGLLADPDALADVVRLALAIPPASSDLRGPLLERVLAAALDRGNYDLAVRVAMGVSGEATEGKALRRVVDAGIDRGVPLQVIDIPAKITAARERALSFLDLGRDLARRGYRQMAAQEFDAAVQASRAIVGTDDRIKTLSAIAAGAADADLGDLAERLLKEIGGGADSHARAAIGAFYARQGDERSAAAWLEKLDSDEDRASLIEPLVRNLLARDDRRAAVHWAEAIGSTAEAAPVRRAIAVAAVAANDGATYDAMLKLLPPGLDRAAALSAGAGRFDPSRDPLKQVAAEIAGLPATDLPQGLVVLADALVRSGKSAAALALAEDPRAKSRRDEILAVVAAAGFARGDSAAALEAVGRLGNSATGAALIADAAIAEAASGDVSSAVKRVAALDDYRQRVRAFRAIAENAARKLDIYGLLGPLAAPGRASAAPGGAAIQPIELDSTDRLRIFRLDGVGWPDAAPKLPDVGVRAADIRAKVPPLEAGVTELSLARLNHFNAKFFEDIVGTSARDYLFNAQSNINPTYVFLSRGTFTLGQIAAQLSDGAGWEIVRSGDVFTLRVPLVIGPYATLILSGAEAHEFRLSASRGAFLVNAGHLYVTDTMLVAYDEDKQAPSLSDYEHKTRFRPFITAWSDSETYVAGSRLVGFGYSAGKTYGLSFTSGPRDTVTLRGGDSRPPTGVVVDSSFEQMLYGFYSFEAKGISIVGNEFRNNIVYGFDPHDRSHDLRVAFNTAYGSEKKHGFIVSREVDDSYLVGNLSFGNHGSGIMLDRDSVGNIIYANTSFENGQDGVTLFESSCNAVLANDLTDNGRGGIKIRNSWEVGLLHNRIGANKGAAIEAYVVQLEGLKDSALRDFKLDPYKPATGVAVGWNTIEGNGIGITLDGANAASLLANTFVNQSPKLYGGDLKALRVRMLGFSSGAAPVLVAGECPPIALKDQCALRQKGLIPGLGLAIASRGSAGAGLCLDSANAGADESVPVATPAKETN